MKWKNIALVGSICKFDQTVFVYLCVCVLVFVYLVPQDSDKTNLAKKIPVCFPQLFCSGALNGLKSVKSVFPLILLILNFSTKQLWPRVPQNLSRTSSGSSSGCVVECTVIKLAKWPMIMTRKTNLHNQLIIGSSRTFTQFTRNHVKACPCPCFVHGAWLFHLSFLARQLHSFPFAFSHQPTRPFLSATN